MGSVGLGWVGVDWVGLGLVGLGMKFKPFESRSTSVCPNFLELRLTTHLGRLTSVSLSLNEAANAEGWHWLFVWSNEFRHSLCKTVGG